MKKRVWYLDIEVLPNYFLCDIKSNGEHRIFERWRDRGDLNKLGKFLMGLGPDDRVVAYNSITYDFPVLAAAMEAGWPSNNDLFGISQLIINSEGFDHWKRKWLNFQHVDLMELLNLNKRGSRVSLKKAAAILGFPKLLDMPKHWSEEVGDGERKMMREYCRVDVDATEFIYLWAEGEVKDREALMEVYPELDLITLGRPRVAKKALAHLYQRETGLSPYKLKEKYWGNDEGAMYGKLSRTKLIGKNIVFPDLKFIDHGAYEVYRAMKNWSRRAWEGDGTKTKAARFELSAEVCGKMYAFGEGGIHDEIGQGVWSSGENHKLFAIDATSYYPNIVRQLGVDPIHLPGLAKLEGDLIDFRTSHKAKRKESERSDRIQKSMKIVINSGVFGLMGDKFSPTFDPEGVLKVTFNGQLGLITLIDWLCSHIGGIEVVHANTDGIAVIVPNELEERMRKACSHWEQVFGIELEIDELGKLVKKNANSYMEIAPDGSIIKGVKEFSVEVSPSKSRQNFAINKGLRAYYAEGIKPEDYIADCDDIHDFLTVVSCGGTSQNYFKIDGSDWAKIQKTLRYYRAVNGGQAGRIFPNGKNVCSWPLADSVRIALDIPDPSTKNYPDLDRGWYVGQIYKEISEIEK